MGLGGDLAVNFLPGVGIFFLFGSIAHFQNPHISLGGGGVEASVNFPKIPGEYFFANAEFH